ncbi:hypothetical protein HJC23_000631 [Cyclotella cryptica]|uniref:Uncharacterized protein n=1 Tax=Cyclotella cryptica TaxID=29204 RepID=A0ABD3Q788_9STRA
MIWPSLDSESLLYLITSLALSVTSTRSEMTDAKSGICKQVCDVTREKSNTPDDEGLNDFIELVDPQCTICYAHVGYQVNLTKGIVCGICNTFSVCHSCHNEDTDFLMKSHCAKGAGRKPSQCSTYLSKVRSGDLIMKQLPSFFIIFNKKILGEGAERTVHKTVHWAADGCKRVTVHRPFQKMTMATNRRVPPQFYDNAKYFR